LKKVGSWAHFFLARKKKLKFDSLIKEVHETVEPVIQSQGLELIDVEYQREAQGWVLRIYLDREGGITVEDCAEASRELGTILEVRDLIPNRYVLEVSSPGLTRPLKKPEDFNKYQNRSVKIRLSSPLEGRRNFKGKLLGLREDKVRLESERQIYEIPIQNIAKANLDVDS
jgi:ribosome maturation factor RimP